MKTIVCIMLLVMGTVIADFNLSMFTSYWLEWVTTEEVGKTYMMDKYEFYYDQKGNERKAIVVIADPNSRMTVHWVKQERFDMKKFNEFAKAYLKKPTGVTAAPKLTTKVVEPNIIEIEKAVDGWIGDANDLLQRQ